jgi:predicted peptidase
MPAAERAAAPADFWLQCDFTFFPAPLHGAMTMRIRLLLIAVVFSLLGTNCLMAQDAALPPSSDPPEPPEAAKPVDVFEARTLIGDEGDAALPYRLLKPLDYDEDADRKYPLVLFLHGAGERGDDNAVQLVHGGRNFADEALRRRHGAFIVAPQCPTGKKWVEVPWNGRNHTMPDDPGPTMNSVFALLDALQKEFKIDANRIYGVGLSMGGYGVWDILQRKPELLAAAVPICGGGDPAYATKFNVTPVWAFHGAADPVVLPDRSRVMIKALQDAGGRPIYTEYEAVGHDSWSMTFDNRLLWDWLFAQRKTD